MPIKTLVIKLCFFTTINNNISISPLLVHGLAYYTRSFARNWPCPVVVDDLGNRFMECLPVGMLWFSQHNVITRREDESKNARGNMSKQERKDNHIKSFDWYEYGYGYWNIEMEMYWENTVSWQCMPQLICKLQSIG